MWPPTVSTPTRDMCTEPVVLASTGSSIPSCSITEPSGQRMKSKRAWKEPRSLINYPMPSGLLPLHLPENTSHPLMHCRRSPVFVFNLLDVYASAEEILRSRAAVAALFGLQTWDITGIPTITKTAIYSLELNAPPLHYAGIKMEMSVHLKINYDSYFSTYEYQNLSDITSWLAFMSNIEYTYAREQVFRAVGLNLDTGSIKYSHFRHPMSGFLYTDIPLGRIHRNIKDPNFTVPWDPITGEILYRTSFN